MLWRISGPGVKPPSYLFGSMHLNDPKAFNFSDSILIALQQANTFALETDFDSTMALLSGQNSAVMSDTTNYIRRYLNDQEYHYTDSLLQAKTGKTIASLRLKIFPTVSGLIAKDTATKANTDDLFMDMWLYQKASRLGKTTHHLEKLQNQIDIFYQKAITPEEKTEFLKHIGYIDDGGASKRHYQKQQDSMMNLYYAADLQKLGELILPTPGANKLRLSERNVEMTSNLVKLFRKNSIFAIAGAAHLPGPNGIIAMLRKQGFTVTPVPVSYTGIAQRERQHLDTLTGFLVDKKADGFSAILPTYPQTMRFPYFNNTIIAAGNAKEGAIISYQDNLTPGSSIQEITDAYFRQLTQNMSAPENVTPIVYNGIPGYEAVMKKAKGLLHLRIFITNNKAYTFGYGSIDSLAYVKFFNNIKFSEPDNSVRYDTLRITAAGVSLQMPANWFSYQDSTYMYVYQALDRKNNIFYYLHIDNPPAGGNELFGTMGTQDQTVDPLANAERSGNIYKHPNGAISQKEVIHRGTSTFTLISTYQPTATNKALVTSFFNSFKVAPQQANKKWITLTDNHFSVTAPVLLEDDRLAFKYGDIGPQIKVYTALDTANQSRYIAATYEWNQEEDLKTVLKEFLAPAEHQVIVRTGEHEIEVKDTLHQCREYRRAIVDGKTIHTAHAYLPETMANSGTGQQFIGSLRLLHE